MTERRVSPYQRLLDQAKAFAVQVKYPRTRHMWTYPAHSLDEGWKLGDLTQRVKAADQLGYDVLVRFTDEGLRVEYVKRPDIPWNWV